MADQDFDINIRTVADLTGARKASDAIAILNEQARRSQAQAGGVGAGAGDGEILSKVEHSFLRPALHLLGAGLVFGAIEEIKRFAEEINKISDSLEKQGEALVKNVQLMSQEARFATTQADVIKEAETGLKGMAEQHKVVEELQKKELGWWETISDIISKIDPTLGPKVGPLQQVLDDALKSATELEEAQRESALHNVVEAKFIKDRRAAQSYAEAVADVTARMKEQQALADTLFAAGDIQSFATAAANAEKYKKELEALAAAHDRLTSKTAKYIEGADPQVQRILQNEAAMFRARAAGDTTSAAMFERSAQALRAGARPDQLADVAKIYSGKEVVDAIKELGKTAREQIDLWK